MDIRNSLDGLKSLFGVNSPQAVTPQPRTAPVQSPGGLGSDQATVSNAAAEVASTASQPTDRLDKVAEIHSALADGSYNVPPAAVAVKVVDSLLRDQ